MSFIRKVKLTGIMLFIIAAIVPLIVRLIEVPVEAELALLTGVEFFPDVFSYHKAWVLLTCVAVIVFYWISEQITKGIDSDVKKDGMALLRDPVMVMVAVYLLFVLLSNILSQHTQLALWGSHDRREGLFVQLAYMIVFLATLFYVKEENRWRLLLAGLLVSSLIMGLIGFSQFIDRDFFATALAFRLVVPSHLAMYMETPRLNPIFEIAYGTSFNPNTFGLITAMLLPVMVSGAVVFRGRLWRGLFILAGLLMVVGIIGSRSVGGFIGAGGAIAVVMMTLAARWFFLRQKETGSFSPKTLAVLLCGLIIVLGVGVVLRQPIYQNLSFTMGRIGAIFTPPDVELTDFVFAENRLTITDRGVTYHITFPIAAGIPEVTIADGVQIEPHITEEEGTPLINYIYEIPGFGHAVILRHDDIYMYRDIFLEVTGGSLYLLLRDGTLIDPNEPIPSFGFEGWETWGSNRGFIFARTIPLIPRFLLIGSGSDTFALQFPNHDIISSVRYFGSPVVVDKAHNLYLQTAVTTGLISALALIGLFGYFILTTFWSLVRHSKETKSSVFWLRLGILASVSAYSVSSLSTDSTVSSTPMFWIIIGIGYALSRLPQDRVQGEI